MSGRRLGWTLVLALALTPPRVATAAELEIAIVSPEPRTPVFGQVEFAVEVYPAGAEATVELRVDGELVGTRDAAPYSVRVDVGQENREHRFEATALEPGGATATAVLVTPPIRIDETIEASLRQLYVTVSTDEGRVLDLEEAGFEVVDDGARQEIVTFSPGNVALAAVVLIDASSSMQGRKLRFALQAATEFASGMKPEDETSIQLFSDRLLYASPFAGDAAAASAGLGGVRADGGTALHDHLYRALKLLEERQGRRVVVFLSDGVDSHSVLGMAEVAWWARRSRAMIYWIQVERTSGTEFRYSSWKSPERYRQDSRLLATVVRESGGRVVVLDRIEDAAEAAREILAELREQYVLGYYPSTRRGDGSWHKVAVRVRRPGLRVRSRGGYLDY